MNNSPLTAISPVDGRYANSTNELKEYFSEYALMKYRLKAEVEYFIFLSEKKFFSLNRKQKESLIERSEQFSVEDAQKIKDTEKITNHDVKAVEYFLKEQLDSIGAGQHKEWVHFGLTSQDINNTAIPMLWRDAVEESYCLQSSTVSNIFINLQTSGKKYRCWQRHMASRHLRLFWEKR